MPKSSVKQIELDEKKILNELIKNANKSINDIAKTLGFSRQKVWRVIKNLEKNKTIWGYTVVLDHQKLAKERFVMLIKRSNKPLSEKFLDQIISRDIENIAKKRGINMINSVYVNGVYDWLISFTANNIKEAKSFVELMNGSYPEIISGIDLLEYMFPVEYDGIINPEAKKLKEFFKI